MKKLLFTMIFILSLSLSSFANENTFFTPEISLGTGVSIYDDKADTNRKLLLNDSDFKRIIVGLTLDTDLNISEPIKVLFGSEAFCDFLWSGGRYFHTIDYAFFAGIKIFPNVKGLNFSISYTLGNRADFSELEEKETSSKAWGNGFRLAVQYNFMQQKDYKIKPHAGAYYRCVPRGNYNTDHSLCLYGGIRF